VTVPRTTFGETLDNTMVGGAPAAQYQAVEETFSGETKLAPAAGVTGATDGAGGPGATFAVRRAATVTPVNATTTTADIKSRLAASPMSGSAGRDHGFGIPTAPAHACRPTVR